MMKARIIAGIISQGPPEMRLRPPEVADAQQIGVPAATPVAPQTWTAWPAAIPALN
jgi:hypothetical protein